MHSFTSHFHAIIELIHSILGHFIDANNENMLAIDDIESMLLPHLAE